MAPSMATNIVRRPFWRRTWFIVLSVLAGTSAALVLMLSIAVHSIQLVDVPDITEPFDLEKFGHVEIAPEQNAFELYRAASEKLVSETNDVRKDALFDVIKGGWSKCPDEVRSWLEENRDALELFREGSERPEAVYFQPAEKTCVTQLVVTNRLRTLAQLACLEASRVEANMKPAAAWKWLSAVHRASRHSGMHGDTVERMVGISMYNWAYRATVHWAANPRLTGADLRQVLADVREIHARTVPASETLMAEYLISRKYYADVSLFARDLDFPWYIANRCVMYPLAEPELGRRLTKMIWTNWLSQCDRPRHLRAPIAAGQAGLYAVDSGAPPLKTGLPIARIESCLERSVLGKYFLRVPPEFVVCHDGEIARQLLLEVTLTLQIYFHEHAAYPDSLEQIVRHGLDEVPADPFGNGEPIRYRRERNAADGVTIWSIGPDGIDEGGGEYFADKDNRKDDRGDITCRVRPPQLLESAR